MQQQILSLGLEQLESEEQIMLHVGKMPREFENWLSRCIWTSKCDVAAAYQYWSKGETAAIAHFLYFYEEMEHYFETLQLEDSPSF